MNLKRPSLAFVSSQGLRRAPVSRSRSSTTVRHRLQRRLSSPGRGNTARPSARSAHASAGRQSGEVCSTAASRSRSLDFQPLGRRDSGVSGRAGTLTIFSISRMSACRQLFSGGWPASSQTGLDSRFAPSEFKERSGPFQQQARDWVLTARVYTDSWETPSNRTDLVTVLLHDFRAWIGFQNFVDRDRGTFIVQADIYPCHLTPERPG